ncbi:MAG: NERD domain-containing protein, partial [Pseudomonadota bacterium]
MAKLVPSTPPEGTTFGERRVFDALSRLPDDCIVYYEPKIAGRTPDFIVIMPSLGVLVIEVKDWFASTVQQADSNQVTLKLDTEEGSKKVMHPCRQATEYMHRLMSQAEGHSQSRVLLDVDEKCKGQFLFPFAQLVIFTRITSSPKSAINNWDEVFSPNETLYSSDLNAWAELLGDELLAAVKKRFKLWWEFNPLNQKQIDILRSIVHPELIIPTLPLQFQAEDELRILDLHQERQARQIGRGHRILYGISGSGKTILLVARAKFLVQVPKYEILILCRNRPLAQYLRSITQHKQIVSSTFHSWGQSLGLSWWDYSDGDAYGEHLLQRLNELPNRKRYDAVLVDEGQDFHGSWFTCAKAALNDPDDGNLLIV